MSVNIRPLHDRIVVQRLAYETKTAGGIIIPESAKEKPLKGKVVSTGKGKMSDGGKLLPLDVKTGDTVLFGQYAGTEFKMDGEEYVMMREDDIYGILN